MTDGVSTLPDAEPTGYVASLDDPSPTLLVAFGGYRLQFGGIPPFEFFNIAQAQSAKTLFIRDLDESIYFAGVRGLGSDIESVASSLRQIVADSGATRTVFMGNCGGAFAALTFGALVGADEVHAFRPPTFFDARRRRRWRDRRWPEIIARLHANHGDDHPRYDVRAAVRDAQPHTRMHVHVPMLTRLDVIHALRLAGMRGVRLHAYRAESEGFARGLRDSGRLARILGGALERTLS